MVTSTTAGLSLRPTIEIRLSVREREREGRREGEGGEREREEGGREGGRGGREEGERREGGRGRGGERGREGGRREGGREGRERERGREGGEGDKEFCEEEQGQTFLPTLSCPLRFFLRRSFLFFSADLRGSVSVAEKTNVCQFRPSDSAPDSTPFAPLIRSNIHASSW